MSQSMMLMAGSSRPPMSKVSATCVDVRDAWLITLFATAVELSEGDGDCDGAGDGDGDGEAGRRCRRRCRSRGGGRLSGEAAACEHDRKEPDRGEPSGHRTPRRVERSIAACSFMSAEQTYRGASALRSGSSRAA